MIQSKITTLALLLLPLLSMGSLWARSISEEEVSPTAVADSMMLDSVVVTAFKYDRNFSTEPLATTTLTSISLENKHIETIKDLSSFIPNFYMPDYGSKLTSAIYIRGIGSKINSPSVGLYVDGIPYFEKSTFDFEFSEIDAIDVLRGPQGTLYGRNTMGGIINIYTKSPLTYEGTNIKLGYGNYGNYEARVSHYGNTSSKFGYAISANYNHLDGYFTNTFTNTPADDEDAGSARIRLEWQPNPRLKYTLSSSIDISKQHGYPYAMIDLETGERSAVNYNDESRYDRTISTTGFTVDYSGERFKMNSITAYQYMDDFQGIDQDFSPESLYYVTQTQKQHQLSQEVSFKGANDQSRYQWLVGAFGFWQGTDSNVVMDYFAYNMTTDKLYDTPTYGAALYHQSIFKDVLIQRMDVTLGLRYDYEKSTMDYDYKTTLSGTTTPTDAFVSPLSSSQFSPKVALSYNLPQHGMLYGSITKGFKAGGFNTSFEAEEDRSFDPEQSWSYEVGSKLNFWGNRINIEMALFYIDWRNQQIYQPLPSGQGQMLKNAGRSRSKGAEVSFSIRPINRLTLQAAYGYTDARFVEYVRSDELDYSGNYIPQVPDQTLSSSATYVWSNLTPWIDRLSVNLNYKMVGKIYWTDSNSQLQNSYQILSSNVSLTHKAFTYTLWGNNLTNSSYMAYYFESLGNGYAQMARPLTCGVSVSVGF